MRAVLHTRRNVARAEDTEHLSQAHGIVARNDPEVADPALVLGQLVLQLAKVVRRLRPHDEAA